MSYYGVTCNVRKVSSLNVRCRLPFSLQLRIQAADQLGEAVTEVLFWDGPETGIATYKYEVAKDFVNCECCFDNPIPQVSFALQIVEVVKTKAISFYIANLLMIYFKGCGNKIFTKACR